MTTPRTPRLPGTRLFALAKSFIADHALLDAVQQTLADTQVEWLAAPDRMTRMRVRARGYVAAWLVILSAPITFRRWPQRRPTTLFAFAHWRPDMTPVSRVALVGTLLIAGMAAGYTGSRLRTPQYKSTAVIQVVPARVPHTLTEAASAPPSQGLGERLMMITQTVLGRTRLERVIREFNLYEAERQSMLMEDVIELMRRHVALTASSPSAFMLSYSYPDPTVAMKVTETLAAVFVDQGTLDRERTAEATLAFLDTRIDAARRDLAEVAARVARTSPNDAQAVPLRLELDVMESTYKTLLMRRAEAQARVSIEQRKIGEQFVVLDAPQIARQPIGPTSAQFMLSGGVAGLVVAGLWSLAIGLRSLLQRRRTLAAANT